MPDFVESLCNIWKKNSRVTHLIFPLKVDEIASIISGGKSRLTNFNYSTMDEIVVIYRVNLLKGYYFYLNSWYNCILIFFSLTRLIQTQNFHLNYNIHKSFSIYTYKHIRTNTYVRAHTHTHTFIRNIRKLHVTFIRPTFISVLYSFHNLIPTFEEHYKIV